MSGQGRNRQLIVLAVFQQVNSLVGQLPAVIIPVHNAAAALVNCLESVWQTVPQTAEVLILDDASDDPAIQLLIREFLGKAGPGWPPHSAG